LLLVRADQGDLPQAADPLAAAPARAPDALHLVQEVDLGQALRARRLPRLVVGVVLQRVVLDRALMLAARVVVNRHGPLLQRAAEYTTRASTTESNADDTT